MPSERRVLVEGPAVQLVAGTEATEDRLLAMQKELKQEEYFEWEYSTLQIMSLTHMLPEGTEFGFLLFDGGTMEA